MHIIDVCVCIYIYIYEFVYSTQYAYADAHGVQYATYAVHTQQLMLHHTDSRHDNRQMELHRKHLMYMTT